MAQRRFHYEQAFEHYLRANRIPYVAVDEAKKALLPSGHSMRAIKSFDFVVYGSQRNMLVDVKGRMYGGTVRPRAGKSSDQGGPDANVGDVPRRRAPGSRPSGGGGGGGARYESWVTQDDVDSMMQWQELFGAEFTAVFVFLYCLRRQPPDALFEEVFEYGGRWYALREVSLGDYLREMVPRSGKWGTVHVPAAKFMTISREFRPHREATTKAQPSVGRKPRPKRC